MLEKALTLVKALKDKDMDEERLARAKAEEAAAADAYKVAEEASGAKKQAIFEQQKKREEEMKMAEASRPAPVKPQAAAAVAGTGSVWNTNSYHWEEKSVASWSEDTLRAAISKFKHTMNDATFSISEITKLSGESSVSIRKGKKIISFDYSIALDW